MKIILLVLFVLVFGAPVWPQTVIQNQTFLTAPAAPWKIRIDGKSLDITKVQAKPDGRSIYVLMIDPKEEMNVSIFIEPVDRCKTTDECRDLVLNSGNPGWGKFQDLAKGKLGDSSYFEFFRPVAGGQPLRMFDMYAEFVRDGYWVDLHLSKTSYKKEDHALFENYVKAMTFVSKPGGQANDAEKLSDSVQRISTDWLALWDGGKCRETYNALTSISRAAVTEKTWIPYCENSLKNVGKLESRQLITASLIKSLPSKPDYSGATLHYQSAFSAGLALEYVTLTLEKDGRWTVSNYLLRPMGN
jgi:hypothetical protein